MIGERIDPGYIWVYSAFPTGIEPAHPVPETGALSAELRELHHEYTIKIKLSQRLLPSNSAVACFHKRVDAVGDKPKCDDTQQQLAKRLVRKFE